MAVGLCLAKNSDPDDEVSDPISDGLRFGRLWYGKPNAISNAIGYAKFYSRSHNAVIRVYDAAGNVDPDARARGRVQSVVKVCARV